MPVDRQITEKLLDFRLRPAQVLPGAHRVETDVAANPVAVAALRADGVVFETHHLAHLIQQSQFGVRGDQVRANAVASLPVVRSSGLTSLIRLPNLLKYANETRN